MAELESFDNPTEEKLAIMTDIADGIFNIDTELTAMKNNNAEASEKMLHAIQDLASHVSSLDDRLRILADTLENGFDRLGDVMANAIAQAAEDMSK